MSDKLHIVLIDNNQELRKSIAAELSPPYSIQTFTDGNNLLNLALETHPAVLIAALSTLGDRGLDAIRELRCDPRTHEIPIIVYADPGDEESRIRAFDAGIDDYLMKPFSDRELLTRIRSQLKRADNRARALQTLQESEERYRTLATVTTSAVWQTTPTGAVFGEVEGWESMTGQTREQYSGWGWLEVVHPDDRKRLAEAWRGALATLAPLDVEYRNKRRDGSYGTVHSKAAPVFNGDGSVREWIGTLTDITERNRAESALRASEEEYRANFESAEIGQLQTDPNTGHLVRVNRRFCEMVGYSEEELIGRHFLEITHPDDRTLNTETIQPFLRGETDEYTIEKRYVRKDGSSIWVLLTATLIRDADRRPQRILAMIQDIDARKQVEVMSECQKMALEKVAQGASVSEVLELVILAFEKVADQSLISILLLDEDGEHLRVGAAPSLPETACLIGEGLSVQSAATPCALAIKEGRPVVIADLESEPEWAGFADLVTNFGVRAVWSTPILSPDQKVLGSFCCYFRQPRTPSATEQWMVENVTRTIALAIERKRAEAEREALLLRERIAREQAEAASQVKDEFLMVVSHELRTPLNAINGWAYLLLGGGMDPGGQRRALHAIQRNVQSQRRLIDDLLDVARIVSGKTRLELRQLEPSRVIASAMDVVRPAAEAKKIEIRVHADESANMISADPERLQQVIWNLLSNAIKFTPEGGRVDVSTRRTGSELEIRVADTGQGINPDFLPHVFERFRQADASTTRAHGGLGLGLAIVRHLVEMHGGTVSVESEGRGRGTAFILRLPIRADRRKTLARRFKTPENTFEGLPQDFQDLNGLQILVVDDDPDTSEALSTALTLHGARATACASVTDALSHVDRYRPDILVADIGMPGEDGYSLIRKIRARPANQGGSTPGIALTAYAGDANRQRALEAGFQKHMVKPVEPDELITAICNLAAQRKVVS